MNIQREGISFGETSNDETPSASEHQHLEPSSYSLLKIQQDYARIKREIKAQFQGEEERKFHKTMTTAYKKTARREARLDLEEDNRKELLSLKKKLEAEMLGKQNVQMESYRAQLKSKDDRIKELEESSGESEKDEKIRELRALLESIENNREVQEL